MPLTPLLIEVLLDDEVVAVIRADLVDAEIGNGRHAFWLRLPPEASARPSVVLGAKIRATGQQLSNSPVILEAGDSEPLVFA